MADEQINVKITGDYDDKDAKQAITDAEKIEKLDPELTIEVDDQASDALADVTDEAKEIEQLSPEIEVTADTSQAESGMADVGDKAQALTREDIELIIQARVDAALTDLQRVQSELKTTQERADEANRHLDRTTAGGAGPNVRGQAIADLTGPLGEASGAASDFAGVFDGIGDIAEGVASKVGISAATMTGAITGIGVAVAAGAALWTLFRSKQEEARRKQQEMLTGQQKLNDAIREGNREAAAKAFVDLYGDAIDKAEQLGANVKDTTAFITGQRDVLPGLNTEIDRYNQLIAEGGGASQEALGALVLHRDELVGLRDDVLGTRDAYQQANGTLTEQEQRLDDVSSALGTTKRATGQLGTASDQAARDVQHLETALEGLQGELDIEQAMLDFETTFKEAVDNSGESLNESKQDVLNWKQFILDTGTELGRTPIEINTALNEVDQGDLVASHNTVQRWFDERPITVTIGGIKLRLTAAQRAMFGDTIIPGLGVPQSVVPEPAPVPQVINVNMPRGARGVDVLRQVSGQARRSGRRYGVPVVHYARRAG